MSVGTYLCDKIVIYVYIIPSKTLICLLLHICRVDIRNWKIASFSITLFSHDNEVLTPMGHILKFGSWSKGAIQHKNV